MLLTRLAPVGPSAGSRDRYWLRDCDVAAMTDDLLAFDEERLRQAVETLNPEVRAIFAAACAE